MNKQYFLNQCDQAGIQISDNGSLVTCAYKNTLLGHIKGDFDSAWADIIYKRNLIDFCDKHITWDKTYIFNHIPRIKLTNQKFELQFTVQKDIVSNLEIRMKVPVHVNQTATDQVFIGSVSKILTEKIPFTTKTKDLTTLLNELLPLLETI